MIEPGPLASHLLPFFYLRQFYAGLTYQKLSVWRTVEFYRSKDLPNRRRISSDSGEGGMKSAIPEADHDGRSASVFDVAIRPSSKTSSRYVWRDVRRDDMSEFGGNVIEDEPASQCVVRTFPTRPAHGSCHRHRFFSTGFFADLPLSK